MTRMVHAIGAAVLAALVVAGGGASAADATVGDITVKSPWARASAGAARAGAAFMTIENAGAEDDRLISASADVSKTVELHTHLMDGDVMKMRPVDAVDVQAGGTAVLQPGGDHVMFMGLQQPLKEGESFPLTLTFETAGSITVDVPVVGAGAMGPGHGGMGTSPHDMGHGKAGD
ncbi:MAG: copper chaperone PCu(A)C [Rhodospirillales bacterium]|nr:copper chaperone PCu(A)C [Rhodospirillales bacterium]